MKFTDMPLHEELKKAIADMGFETATEIQEKTIPLAQKGLDILGESKTGSGKTAAFGLPLLEKIQKAGMIQAIILAPTRELAIQIAKEMRKFSKYMNLEIVEIYGGVPIEKQFRELKSADIVVGTPGRVLDHLERRTIDFRHINTLVLDEADRMFDMGFIDDVEKIIDAIPKTRQTMLFSATLNRDVKDLAGRHLKDPQEIRVEARIKKSLLKQYYFDIKPYDKFSLLVHMIQKDKPTRAIVFCATRRIVDVVSKNLTQHKINAQCIHGGLPQNKRTRVIEAFHEGKDMILVATDVAARGLDIKNVTHIFNYDIPNVAEDYIHRVGRTARAGESGVAYAFLAQRDYENFQRVISQARVEIEKIDPGRFQRLRFDPTAGQSDRDGDRGGPRGSGNRGSPRTGGRRDGPSYGSRGPKPQGGRGPSRFGGSSSSGSKGKIDYNLIGM